MQNRPTPPPCYACGLPAGVHHATVDGRPVLLCASDLWSWQGRPGSRSVPLHAVEIRVEDLETAMEAMEIGSAVASAASRGFDRDIRPPFRENGVRLSGSDDFVVHCATVAGALARLALGEG